MTTAVLGVLLGALLGGICITTRRKPAVGVVIALTSLIGAISIYEPIREVFLLARWGPLFALAVTALLEPGGALPRSWIAFGAVAVASTVWSVDPQLTLLRAISVLLVLFIGCRLAPAIRRDALEVVTGVAAVGALVVTASIGVWLTTPSRGTLSDELRGVIENANGLGLVVAITYLAVLASVDGRLGGRLVTALAVAPAAALLALSAGRSGMLLLLSALAVYELTGRRGRRLVAHVAIAAPILVLLSAAGPAISPRQEIEVAVPVETPTPDSTETPPTTTARVPVPSEPRASVFGTNRAENQSFLTAVTGGRSEAWREVARLAPKRPVLGHGFGTGDRLFDRYDVQFRFFQGDNPNNSYLQLLLELGWIGWIAPLAAIGACLVATVRTIRRRDVDAPTSFLVALVPGLCLAAMVESLLTTAGAPWTPLFWWSAGVVVAGRSDLIDLLPARLRRAVPLRSVAV